MQAGEIWTDVVWCTGHIEVVSTGPVAVYVTAHFKNAHNNMYECSILVPLATELYGGASRTWDTYQSSHFTSINVTWQSGNTWNATRHRVRN